MAVNTMKQFDPALEIEHIVTWIREYFANNGDENTKAVIGISGGKDSTIAAALLVRALGADRVIGVLMPQIYQNDIDDSHLVCNLLNIFYCKIDIGEACRSLYSEIDEELGIDSEDNLMISSNTPARIRMATLYAVAALVHGRVCNTCNASERYVGYSTKYGDNAGDFALFHDYTVEELYQIGDALGLPAELVHKTPSDGMRGTSDEEAIGASYVNIGKMYRDINTNEIPFDEYQRIADLHKKARHKNDAVRLTHPVVQSYSDRRRLF
jgi:NAD+ synthase